MFATSDRARPAPLSREAELALRASEQKFRSLVENSPDLIARFDPQGRIVYISPSVKKYSTLTDKDVRNKTLAELPIDPEYAAFLQNNITRARELRTAVQGSLHFTSTNKLDLTIECRTWPEFDINGDIAFIVVQWRDISSVHRLEQSYHALFSSMIDGFALFKAQAASPGKEEEFTLLLVNPAFIKMRSLPVEHGAGQSLSGLMGAAAPDWLRIFRQVIANGEQVTDQIYDAAVNRYFEISAYSPEKERIACIVKDVTELRVNSEKIRLNEARQVALYAISQLNDDIPEEEVIRFALDKAIQLTGSLAGALFFSPSHGFDAPRHFWLPGSSMTDEEQQTRQDMSRRLFETAYANQIPPGIYNEATSGLPQKLVQGRMKRCMLASIRERGKIVCIAGVADKAVPYETSDLRQLELFINGMWQILRRRWTMTSLTRAKVEAELASRAKSEFLANVSHELRTPLNGVLGMLQLLQLSTLTRDQREWVETADFSSKSLLSIISDILDFSRAEAGKLELRRQPFSLEQALRRAIDIFAHDARSKHLDFALYVDPAVPVQLLGDDARIRQVVFNLVGNAIKFTEQGSVYVHCSVLPRGPKDCITVYITVADTGIGIPEDKLSYIFQAFTQLDGSNTRPYPGTGLGLGIVRRLIGLLNGSLCVESAPGRGTVMHVTLPFELATVPPPPQIRAPSAYSGPSRPLRILVAEDDHVNQITIRGMLSRLGHRVACVENGSLALEALAREDFDCLFSDIQMPVMSGMELLRHILASRSNGAGKNSAIPIVALTAHAMAGDRERFLNAGFDEYIAKPIAISDLQKTLSWLSQKLTTDAPVSDKELP